MSVVQNMMSNPVSAIILVGVVALFGLALLVLGLCVLALFLPLVLIGIGLFVLFRGPFPMNARLLVGTGLIIGGALYAVVAW